MVRGRRERARDGVSIDVRHLLDAADDHDLVRAARDRDVAGARGRAARRARGLDRQRLDAREAGVVRDQAAELLLLGEHARHHVADVQRADSIGLDAGVRESRFHGGRGAMPAADVASPC